MKPRQTVIKKIEKPVQKTRFIIQVLFFLLCLWIGVEFYSFVQYLETGGEAGSFARPPGVDGFLPISSMMSVYYFFLSGEIHTAHPAGFFIFTAIVVVSIFFGKSFCSWLCPIGLLSELIGDFGEKVFKRRLKLPKILDIPLRSLKYLLLGFLFYSVFFLMSELALRMFLDSDYNLVSDIKMYYFFADISRTSIIVISILFLLSIVIRNFWCRFLCPYGALLGVISFLSPNKIKRNENLCIDCNLCAKACPSFVKVDKVKYVYSDECTSCLSCVDVCPVKDALYVENIVNKKKFQKRQMGFIVVVVFMIIAGIGMLTGNWQNTINKNDYLFLFQDIKSFDHPTGTGKIKELNRKANNGSKGKIIEGNVSEGSKID